MGKGMSRRRNSRSCLEIVQVSAAEPQLGANQEKLTSTLGQSTCTSTSQANSSRMNMAAHIDPEEPRKFLPGWQEDWEEDLAFEDCQEYFPGDPLLLTMKVPQPGKRWEWRSQNAQMEPKAQGQMPSLTKGTQTEATCSGFEDSCYFQTGKDPNLVYMLEAAKRSEKAIQQVLQEFFGFWKFLMTIFTLFIHELICFLSKSVFQVLVVDLITVIGDQMLEPLLAALLRSILQPLLIFLLSLIYGVWSLSCPILDILKGICLQVAVVVRAFRLVEVNNHPRTPHAEQL